MAAISETQRAYLAGFFDGDGCVNITHTSSNCGTDYYRLQVVLTQKSVEFLELLREQIGGIGSIHVSQTKNPHNDRDCWIANWRIVSYQSERFLRLIEPYVIRKAEQVKIALELRNTMRAYGNGRGVPKGTNRKRHQLMLRMQALNNGQDLPPQEEMKDNEESPIQITMSLFPEGLDL